MGQTEHSSLCDAIPPSIEHLWLELPSTIPSYLEPQLLAIYQRSLQGLFPHLKSIKLSWVRDWALSHIESIFNLPFDFSSLQALFETSSILFDFSFYCFFDEGPYIIQFHQPDNY